MSDAARPLDRHALKLACAKCGAQTDPIVQYHIDDALVCRECFRKEDMVKHPPHYTMGGIEVLDAIEAWKLGYHEGNIVKYIARAKYKGNELQDLQKAAEYLRRLIALKEKHRDTPLEIPLVQRGTIPTQVGR